MKLFLKSTSCQFASQTAVTLHITPVGKSALLVKIVKNAQRRTVHFYLHADANPTSIE